MTQETSPSDMFKERLKAARELRKLNQTELAQKAKLPASSIAHFEGGSRKPSFDNLRRLAAALEVTTDYLIGRTDDPSLTPAVVEAEDPLFRHMSKLSAHDKRLAQDYVEFLAQRAKDKAEGQGS